MYYLCPSFFPLVFNICLCFSFIYSKKKKKRKDNLGCILEKAMATHSSVLVWRIPGTGEPGGLLSMVSHRVRHDWSDLAAAAAAAGCILRSACLIGKFRVISLGRKKPQTRYFIVSVINANKLIQTKLCFSKLYIHKYHFFYYNIQLFFHIKPSMIFIYYIQCFFIPLKKSAF